MKFLLNSTLFLFIISTVSLSTHAALHDRGNAMIYDDVLDITWINRIIAPEIRSEAGNVALHFTNVGYSDWRLPSCNRDGSGCQHGSAGHGEFDALSSEMAHLFFVTLGNAPGTSTSCGGSPTTYPPCLQNIGPFSADVLLVDYHPHYWLNEAVVAGETNYFYFSLRTGNQGGLGGSNTAHILVVRDGDVDPDGDGIYTPDMPGYAIDNCPNVYNPLQENADNDEYGDACDTLPPQAPTASFSIENATTTDGFVLIHNDVSFIIPLPDQQWLTTDPSGVNYEYVKANSVANARWSFTTAGPGTYTFSVNVPSTGDNTTKAVYQIQGLSSAITGDQVNLSIALGTYTLLANTRYIVTLNADSSATENDGNLVADSLQVDLITP